MVTWVERGDIFKLLTSKDYSFLAIMDQNLFFDMFMVGKDKLTIIIFVTIVIETLPNRRNSHFMSLLILLSSALHQKKIFFDHKTIIEKGRTILDS